MGFDSKPVALRVLPFADMATNKRWVSAIDDVRVAGDATPHPHVGGSAL